MKLPKTSCISVTEVTLGINHIKADHSQAKPWADGLLDRSSQKPGSTLQAVCLQGENLSLTGQTWGTQDWDLSKPKISQHLELVNNYTVVHIPGDFAWNLCPEAESWYHPEYLASEESSSGIGCFVHCPLGHIWRHRGKMVSTWEFRVDWAVWSQRTRKRQH